MNRQNFYQGSTGFFGTDPQAEHAGWTHLAPGQDALGHRVVEVTRKGFGVLPVLGDALTGTQPSPQHLH